MTKIALPLGKEYYHDKDNKIRVRFIPGFFDNSLGELFDCIMKESVMDCNSNLHCWEILRHNSRCLIHYSVTNDIEDPKYEISYFFNTQCQRIHKTLIAFGTNANTNGSM